MKYFTDLILGKGFCIFIFFHFPDSSPSVLNGLHSYFSLGDSASREYVSVDLLIVTLSLHNDREKNQRSNKQVLHIAVYCGNAIIPCVK